MGGHVCAFAIVALAGGVFQAEAQSYMLSQKDSSVQIDLSSGLSNWHIDNVNQVNQQWFYYRVGSTGPEASIDTIASPSSVSSSSNSINSKLNATYVNATISVQTVYTLQGQTPGSGKATLSESITVKNTSALTQDFHFYQYSDFDLGGVSGDQNVQFYNNGSSSYYEVIQTGGLSTLTETATASAANTSEVQAGLYGATLLGLADGVATTLDNTLLAGPGNVVYGYEWDVTLAPGGSLGISKILSVVPEPSVITLAALGAGIVALLRRRTRAV
jgi:hypothetical protein